MNWLNSRKSSWTCFAGIAFAIMVLLSRSSCSASTSTKAPTDTPVPKTAIASVPTDIPTITSPTTATDTPTPTYPAPTLVNPAPGATILGEKETNFSWHWDGDLQEQEGEKFDLRIWRVEKECCTVAMPCKCSYPLDAPPNGFGQYQWQVAVVRIGENGKSILSESLVWPFVWSDVPTSTPTHTPTNTPTSTATPAPTDTPTVTPTPTTPPTLLPGSRLLEPENAARFCENVRLTWEWVRPLEDNEVFSVRIRAEGDPIPTPCHHTQTKIGQYEGKPFGCNNGRHYWSVAAARKVDDPKEWEPLSEGSEERWFDFFVSCEEPGPPRH